MTNEAFAEALNVSIATIHRWKKGHEPSLLHRRRILAFLEGTPVVFPTREVQVLTNRESALLRVCDLLISLRLNLIDPHKVVAAIEDLIKGTQSV